ncbi:MAG: hypothetical protein KJ067_21865 [Vicinamibacteria bacterium]|nr:hypothetical protein [Vicinamibacteria bacterium]
MTDRIDERLLAELGIADARLVDAEPLAWPESDVGAASGLGAAVTLAMLAAGARTAPVAHPGLAEAGLTAAYAIDAPRLIELASEGPITVRASPDGADAVLQSPEHPNVAWLDLFRSGPVAVTTSRLTLLVVPGEKGLLLREVVPPDAPLEAPLADWLASCSDPWLVEQLRPLARDGWSAAVAAGMLARLVEPRHLGHERLTALVAGRVDPELARPRQWARSLSPAAVATLERRAVERAQSLLSPLVALEPRIDDDAPDWPAEWVALCRSRDDLEGVTILLHEAGRGERLEAALAPVDDLGRRVAAGVPLRRVPRDERLRRAALNDPDAWWGLAR